MVKRVAALTLTTTGFGVLAVRSPEIAIAAALAIFVLSFQSVVLIAQLSIFFALVVGAYDVPLPTVGISVPFLLTFCSLVLLCLKYPEARASRPVRGASLFVGVTLSGYGASVIVNGPPASWAGVYEFWTYATVLLTVAILTVANSDALSAPIGAAALFHATVGAYEFLSGTSIFYSSWKGDAASMVGPFLRAASTTGDPNYLALTLMSLGFGALHLRRVNSAKSALLTIAGTLSLAAIPLTFSRAGIASLAAALLISTLREKSPDVRIRRIVIGSLIAVPVVLMSGPLRLALLGRMGGIGDSDASYSQRRAVQELGVKLVLEHPWLGVGPHAFPVYAESLHDPSRPYDVQTAILNTYLYAWLSGGILAGLALAWLLARILRQTWRTNTSLLAGTCACLLTIGSLDAYTLIPFWTLIGIGMGARRWSEIEPMDDSETLKRGTT